MRTLSWIRQNKAPKIEVCLVINGKEKPISIFADLGSEMVTGPPVYEAGDFVVLDTVQDCEWTVAWVQPGTVQALRKTTDKYEAIRWADEFHTGDGGFPLIEVARGGIRFRSVE